MQQAPPALLNMRKLLENLKPKAFFFTTLVIIIFSLLLRIILGYLNFGANDSHLNVSRLILTEKRLPTRADCWSCYHPKLYHITTAMLLAMGSPKTERDAIRLMQLPNSVLSLLLLALLWEFLNAGPWISKTKILTFALVALNPKLIGIFAQGTNDAYIIFFSTLTLYCTHRFLLSGQRKDLAGLTIGAILAGLSKATGIVIATGVALVLILKIFPLGESPLNCLDENIFMRFWFFFSHFCSSFPLVDNTGITSALTGIPRFQLLAPCLGQDCSGQPLFFTTKNRSTSAAGRASIR